MRKTRFRTNVVKCRPAWGYTGNDWTEKGVQPFHIMMIFSIRYCNRRVKENFLHRFWFVPAGSIYTRFRQKFLESNFKFQNRKSDTEELLSLLFCSHSDIQSIEVAKFDFHLNKNVITLGISGEAFSVFDNNDYANFYSPSSVQ